MRNSPRPSHASPIVYPPGVPVFAICTLLSHTLSGVCGAVMISTPVYSQPVAIPVWLELAAVIAASISGVLTARKRNLDLIGAIALAVVCGLGGGLLRDMTLQVGDVYILKQPLALPISIATAAIIYIVPAVVDKPERLIPVLDILSVGIYSATGADKAFVHGFDPFVCVMMGVFTAVGGGMLRDGFMGDVPGIFQRTNFYAIASIGGGATYVALMSLTPISSVAALVACVFVTIALRWLSIRFDIKSPTEDDFARWFRRKK